MTETWKTVRVFISSTFRDMHAERDYLIKVVFPELRERMANRHLYLVDIDLRWGITEKEAEQGRVLETCLDEIERSRPFFIALLGERYGFVPDSLPEDADVTHPWLAEHAGHSLTALEIAHGVLRAPELALRSFFYFRDPSVTLRIPEPDRSDYTAESEEAASKLEALKQAIRASGRPVFEDYPSSWDEEEKRLVSLDTLGEQVLEDIWQAISAEYPEEARGPDPLTLEREAHEAFAEERSRLHLGREEEAGRLSEYVRGSDRRPIVVTGESGCGKSAFLASWCRRFSAEHPDDLVLPYFVGASPASTDRRRLLRTICEELKRRLSIEDEIPKEDEKLSETLAIFLQVATRSQSRVVLLVDALDQLSALDGAHGLSWLLEYIPAQACLVVSALEGDCLEALRRREAEELALSPLTSEEQRRIVQAVLEQWRRRLDERQLSALLSHPGVESPLYLRVALEELRLFGRFEQLTGRIEALASDTRGLFAQVLERLEADHGRELVERAFSLIDSARDGLSELELLDLLRSENEEQFPRALWARLYRGAGAYLVQRGELVDFFHRQLHEAVSSRYPEQAAIHAELAAYFAHSPRARRLEEYPYQLERSEDWEALASTLSDLDFLVYAFENGRTYEWMGYWRALEGRFEPAACYEAALERFIDAEGESAVVGSMASSVGRFLRDMGLYQSALPFLERSLAIWERSLGPDHVEVAANLNNLADLYRQQGDYDRARPLFERALSIAERTLGRYHPQVVPQSLSNLASLYQDQGDFARALPLFERALAIRERTGADHSDLATSLNNLAGLYRAQSDYDRARPLFERALAICEGLLGPDHPNTAASLNNLAHLYHDQSDYASALPLFERSLAIFERALGPDHPSTATSLNNLAELYRARGEFDRALPLLERALAIEERALGADHPDLATSLNNLAGLYYAQGDYDRALPLLERSLAILERTIGPDHPQLAQILDNLASLYQSQGDVDSALPLFARGAAIAEAALGSDHPITQVLRTDLENCRLLRDGAGAVLIGAEGVRTSRVDADEYTCLQTLEAHTDLVTSIAFNPDGNGLASASRDGTVRLWDPRSGECLRTLVGNMSPVLRVAFSPDGSMLASASDDRTVRLWDPRSSECLRTLEGHTEVPLGVAFSPDGSMLASSAGDGTVRLWNPKSGECLRALTGHSDWVYDIVFNGEGSMLASASDDGTVRLWNPQSGECLRTLVGHMDGVASIAFDPDGSMLASASRDKTVRLWDPRSGECLRTLVGHMDAAFGVAFSPDGCLLASASDDRTVRLWDSRSGECLGTLEGHTDGVVKVAFSPMGSLLASASWDQTVRLWAIGPGASEPSK